MSALVAYSWCEKSNMIGFDRIRSEARTQTDRGTATRTETETDRHTERETRAGWSVGHCSVRQMFKPHCVDALTYCRVLHSLAAGTCSADCTARHFVILVRSRCRVHSWKMSTNLSTSESRIVLLRRNRLITAPCNTVSCLLIRGHKAPA